MKIHWNTITLISLSIKLISVWAVNLNCFVASIICCVEESNSFALLGVWSDKKRDVSRSREYWLMVRLLFTRLVGAAAQEIDGNSFY